jgi:hypothetical protein
MVGYQKDSLTDEKNGENSMITMQELLDVSSNG